MTDVDHRLKELEKKLDEALSRLGFIQSRLTTYVGRGTALTYLPDETPLYVNSADFGPPANYINSGIYEPDNLAVLLSFVRDDTVFLDIGANVGFFAIQVARRAVHGRTHAFEPHPDLARLLRGSAHLNGLGTWSGESGRLICHQLAAGDKDGDVDFTYPEGHLGGGGISGPDQQPSMTVHMRRIDDVLGSEMTADLIKIDVEGHELPAIRGMKKLLQRSSEVALLFEKFEARDEDYEQQIEAEFAELGFRLYAVEPGARLRPLATGGLAGCEGYILAYKGTALVHLNRARLSIYPRQLCTEPSTIVSQGRDLLHAKGTAGAVLFYGPYWGLRQGRYRVRLIGEIVGKVQVSINARVGQVVNTVKLGPGQMEFETVASSDLAHFECVARAIGTAEIRLERIEIEQV